ncbi:MAG: hypothetical protein V3T05_01825 [Myxococcota bacterium]
MKAIRILPCILAGALVADATTGARAGEAFKEVEVKAKLVEIPSKFPPVDLYDYAYVMKYEVVDGDLKGQTLLVAHFNPRVQRKKVKGPVKKYVDGTLRRFKVGAVHQMRLTPDLEKIWNDAVVDEYFATDRKSTRYWCLKVDEAD